METTINLNGAEIAHLQAETANAIAATQFELPAANAEADESEDDSISAVDAQIKAMELQLQLAKIERARKREIIKRKYIAEIGPQLKALSISADDLKDYLTVAVEGKRTFRNPTSGETWSGNESTKGPKPTWVSDLIWQGGKKDFSRLDALEVK